MAFNGWGTSAFGDGGNSAQGHGSLRLLRPLPRSVRLGHWARITGTSCPSLRPSGRRRCAPLFRAAPGNCSCIALPPAIPGGRLRRWSNPSGSHPGPIR